MATPPTLPFDELLAPVPGADPAGSTWSSIFQDSFKRLSSAAEGEEPEWPKAAALARSVLVGESKDLRVAARLTLAQTHIDGYAGARDGLTLMRRMLEECGDRLAPRVPPDAPDDAEDYEKADARDDQETALSARASAFNGLNETDGGMVYPSALRVVPMVKGGLSVIEHRKLAGGKLDDERRADLEARSAAMTAAALADAVEDAREALEEVRRLGPVLEAAGLEEHGAAVNHIRAALEDCRATAEQAMQQRGGSPEAAASATPGVTAAPATGGVPAASSGEAVTRALASRDDAYRAVSDAASLLRRLEPHSPVPYLLERAVALGKLPFPKLVRAMVREQAVLAELVRDFALPEEGETT